MCTNFKYLYNKSDPELHVLLQMMLEEQCCIFLRKQIEEAGILK